MKMDWLDVYEIALELSDKFPNVDPQWISFPDLHDKVCKLENFIGEPKKSNEKNFRSYSNALDRRIRLTLI